jgi:hypothetical protein
MKGGIVCQEDKVPSCSPQLCVQRHMGSGGGLFTGSGSAAHPLFAERLSAIANAKNR